MARKKKKRAPKRRNFVRKHMNDKKSVAFIDRKKEAKKTGKDLCE